MENVSEGALIRKLIKRIVPFLVVVYLVAVIDRLNVGFAALTMNEDLGLTAAAYGLGAGLFFIGYMFFEVPSNLIMMRVGARRWIARIMVTWGVLAVAMGFIQGTNSFYLVRFLLGVAEAGFFPGVLLYLTYWFPEKYRARVLGLFLLASPLSNAIAAPISGLILSFGDIMGVAGWRWLFIIQGLPAVILAWFTLKRLDDGPASADWLSPAEKTWLERRLADEASNRAAMAKLSLMDTLKHPPIILMCLIYTGLSVGLYGVALWLPQIVKGLGVDDTRLIGLIVCAPFVVAAGCMVLWTRHSDHTNERIWHVGAPLFLAAVGLVVSALVTSPVVAMLALTVAAIGIYSAQPTFWALPSGYLAGVSAAAGLAFINCIANVAGFFSPWLVGWLKETTGSFTAPLLMLAACLAIGGAIPFLLNRQAVVAGGVTVPVGRAS